MSKKKWWSEGKEHIECKNIIRAICRKHKAGCVEEERMSLNLHDYEPELWAKKSIRHYQVDLLIHYIRNGVHKRRVIEIDGGYHTERQSKDILRDNAIMKIYGIPTTRLIKEAFFADVETDNGIIKKYTEEYLESVIFQ
jgi:hypothetical protein